MRKVQLFGLIAISTITTINANAASSPTLLTGDYSTNIIDCFHSTPIIIGSVDQEKNWRVIEPNLSFSKGKSLLALNGSDCNPSGCIAVGNDGNTWSDNLLITKSNADLSQWTEVTNIHGMPLFMNSSRLDNINCQGSYCVADGYYFYDSNILRAHPLILTSTDSGTSWNFNSLPNSNLPDYSNAGFSCGNGFCVLAGSVQTSIPTVG
jgi:hypothetical protein